MVDGTGMCGSCRVTVDGKVKFACVEGPDFDGHKVDFKELHGPAEALQGPGGRTANEDYAHVCNLEKQLFEEQKRNYKKIKELAPQQDHMPERDALERSRNFKEVNLGYSLQDALAEAERCIQCAKPTCIAGCPVSIDIPRFIRHLLVRDLDGAARGHPRVERVPLHLRPRLPAGVAVRGAVHHQQEGRVGRHRPARALRRRQRAGSRRSRRRRFAKKLGRVAICGSGPAGLSAAADLVRYGCDVTVYEALHVVGGVLRYGIPSFRLPRDIIDPRGAAADATWA